MPEFPLKTVMISGDFNQFQGRHLSYIKQAIALGDFIICIVSSDRQMRLKKGRKNISPEEHRREIADLILWGLKVNHITEINYLDWETQTVTNALKKYRPSIFARGGDMIRTDMPREEFQTCLDLGITITETRREIDTHG